MRQAGVSLVPAVTVDQVAAAVRSAADALLGGHAQGDALLAVRTDGTLRAVTAASADPAPMGQLGELAETWLPLVTGPAPVLAPSDQAARAGQDGCVPGGDWMLLCPLTLRTGRRATLRSG